MIKRSPSRKPAPKLGFDQLRAARTAYESGQTFDKIGLKYGVSESGMRKLLRQIGVEPRQRGKVPPKLPEELIVLDAKAGLSSRQIAAKHHVNRHLVTSFLRQRGLARAPRLRVVKPVGRRITDEQARLRRRPPIRIPIRTSEECRDNRFTQLELGAIGYEIRAGRYTVVPRGQRGLVWAAPLGLVVHWRTLAERRALPRLEGADKLCPACLCVIQSGLECACPPAGRKVAIPAAVAA
jgi:hypothetical protein